MSEFSAEALRKQAEADRLRAEGKPIPLALMCGIFQPATRATAEERCRHCGSDARPGVMFGGDGEFCGLCLDRGRDADYLRADRAALRAAQRAGGPEGHQEAARPGEGTL